MKAAFLTLLFPFVFTLANAQQWELKWQSGANYTFLSSLYHTVEPVQSQCSPSSAYCYFNGTSGYDLSHTFESRWGGFGQLELGYKLNEKWRLQYAMGSQLQRYQKHVKLEYPKYTGQSDFPWSEPNPNQTPLQDPETGNTRLWYLRHQAGASYQLFPRLALNLSGWADVLLQSAEYQMKYRYNNNVAEDYGAYNKSGAGFKHTVAGVQAGVSYAFFPKLNASLSYSRSLTPTYKKTEFVSPGKAYANQLQLGLAYSLFAI